MADNLRVDPMAAIDDVLERGRIDQALRMGSSILKNSARRDYMDSEDAVDLYDDMLDASDSLDSLERFWDRVQEQYVGPLIMDPVYDETGPAHPDLGPSSGQDGREGYDDGGTDEPYGPEPVDDDIGQDGATDTSDRAVDEPGDAAPSSDYDVDLRIMGDGVYEGDFSFLGRLAGLPANDTAELDYGVSIAGADLEELVDDIAEIRVVGGRYDKKAETDEGERYYNFDTGFLTPLENMEVASFDFDAASSYVGGDDAYFGIDDEDGLSFLQAEATDDEVVYSGQGLGTLEYNSQDDFAYNVQLVDEDGDVAAESGWYEEFDDVEAYDDADALEAIEETYEEMNAFLPGESTGVRDATREVMGRYRNRASRLYNWTADRLWRDGDES
ncbi:MAG: hypothetical protein SV186_01345 [Candidatus Nanohaloarchaea archaeon]|nr:hypothetical protein [Candidatus Nanohaloarchaea archaeon]